MTIIILIYGNGLSAISQKISLIKKDFDPLSIAEFNLKNNTFKNILVEISTQGLFSEERLVILEEADSDIELEKLLELDGLTLVIKVAKNLPQNSKLLKFVNSKKGQIFNFSEKDETPIFPFLDSLADKKKGVINQLDGLVDEYGGQYVLTMIFYLLRRMVFAGNAGEFVRRKIEMQRKNFSLEKIRDLYKLALENDFKVKSGVLDERVGLTLLVREIIS